MKNKVVLITGAANGIGKCLAEQLAAKGARLVLWDKDFDGLNRVKIELENKYKEHILINAFDITNKESLSIALSRILYFNCEDYGIPDVVINNAGIGLNCPIQDVEEDTWKLLIDVNLLAPIKISTRVIRALKEHNKRHPNNPKHVHFVNVASGQGFFRLPTWTAYASTKVALAAYSEALNVEGSKEDISTTTVYPYMVNTGFYDGVEEQANTFLSRMSMKLLPYYSQTPEKVAKIIIRAIEKGKRVEMVHPANYVGYHLNTIPFVGYCFRKIANKFLAG